MTGEKTPSIMFDFILCMICLVMGSVLGAAWAFNLADIRKTELNDKYMAERVRMQNRIDTLVDAVLKNGDGKEWAFKVLKEVISNEKKVSE